ncbi:MAG TPA: hypothetical protein VGE79_04390, partial [Niastella sp.]
PESETRLAEADKNSRYAIICKVLARKIELEGIILSEEEIRLYAGCMSRHFFPRLPQGCVRDIIGVFDKVVAQSKHVNKRAVSKRHLRMYLGLRLLTTLIYQRNIYKPADYLLLLRSRYFYAGLLGILGIKYI